MLLSVSDAFGNTFSFNSRNNHDGQIGWYCQSTAKEPRLREGRRLIHGYSDNPGPRLGPSDSEICGLIFNKQ